MNQRSVNLDLRGRPPHAVSVTCLRLVPPRRVCGPAWQVDAVAGSIIPGTSHHTRSIRVSWPAGVGKRCQVPGPILWHAQRVNGRRCTAAAVSSCVTPSFSLGDDGVDALRTFHPPQCRSDAAGISWFTDLVRGYRVGARRWIHPRTYPCHGDGTIQDGGPFNADLRCAFGEFPRSSPDSPTRLRRSRSFLLLRDPFDCGNSGSTVWCFRCVTANHPGDRCLFDGGEPGHRVPSTPVMMTDSLACTSSTSAERFCRMVFASNMRVDFSHHFLL